jgi:hypothetical protein
VGTQFSCNGQSVVISLVDRNYFFYRQQGVTVTVPNEKSWWCFWCSNTRKVESINCLIELTGSGLEAKVKESCANCGSLEVLGPIFWGFNVPQPYKRVAYDVTVIIGMVRCVHSQVEVFTP